MAVTRLNQIKGRYNKQIDALKEQYKQENNLKIARGFPPKGSFFAKEVKRIKRNERKALYRYEKKKQAQRAKNPISVKVLTPKPQPYHVALDYGGKVSAKRTVRDAFSKAKQNTKGKAARLIIDNQFDGSGSSIYTDEVQALLALKDLYQRSVKYQEETNEYVFIYITSAETDKEFFINVVAKK